jgi:HD-GYP domain-containing protein (c-di-GMP phosphodiesterase class II)
LGYGFLDSKLLYNSRIINTYIKYIKKCYEHINIDEVYRYSHIEPYEVADQNHWFTQEQVNLFHEKLMELTGSEGVAREAGRYAASTESIGVMRQYILGMVSPADVYILISKVANQFTRSATYEAKRINSKNIEIVVTPKEGVHEKPFQCDNRIGQFEAICQLFNNAIPKIDHTECIFKGGKSCRYSISWKSNFSSLLIRTRNMFAFLVAIISATWIAFFPIHDFLHYSPVLILALFLISYFSDRQTKMELRSSILNLEHLCDDLIQKMDINYNNTLLVNEIGQAISGYINIDDVLKNVTRIMQNRLNYERCVIFFANKEKSRLIFKAGFGYSEKHFSILQRTEFNLTNPESKGVFVRSFIEQKPYLINDIGIISDRLSQKSLQFLKDMGSHSFICCPIISDNKSVGIVTVDNCKTHTILVESDLRLLMGVASVLGVSIRNAELHDARTNQFSSILKTLAASIDARDPFTAGHSEKVTEYALGICQEMNIPPAYAEIVGVAASLHDYGKIGISDALLKKEGTLTEDEYEVIKTHTVKTRSILEQIDFQGSYSQIPQIAEAHHEKLDGSGYPRGLKGMDIPIGSRIIAVADFFEAITAKRLYHDPMPIAEAFKMLRRECDVHFSREIVDAFINFYTKKNILPN